MKIILCTLSALLLSLALTQAAGAKTKIPESDSKVAKTEKSKPPLDQTATGGILPLAITTTPADAGQAYPQPLDLHF